MFEPTTDLILVTLPSPVGLHPPPTLNLPETPPPTLELTDHLLVLFLVGANGVTLMVMWSPNALSSANTFHVRNNQPAPPTRPTLAQAVPGNTKLMSSPPLPQIQPGF